MRIVTLPRKKRPGISSVGLEMGPVIHTVINPIFSSSRNYTGIGFTNYDAMIPKFWDACGDMRRWLLRGPLEAIDNNMSYNASEL